MIRDKDAIERIEALSDKHRKAGGFWQQLKGMEGYFGQGDDLGEADVQLALRAAGNAIETFQSAVLEEIGRETLFQIDKDRT